MHKFNVGDIVLYTGSTKRHYVERFVGKEAIVKKQTGHADRRLYLLDFINGSKGYSAFEENLELSFPKEPDWRI